LKSTNVLYQTQVLTHNDEVNKENHVWQQTLVYCVFYQMFIFNQL
jgi:hypothetical protein